MQPRKTIETAYQNPELLIETEWLSLHLDDPDIRIVDMRPKEEYDKGHIRNALHLNHKDITGDETVKRNFPPDNTPDLLGSMGIDMDTRVISYDNDSGHHAARLFWVLEYFGHKRAAILNGGFAKWMKEGREITTAVPEIGKKRFLPETDKNRIAQADEIAAKLSDPGTVILDSRTPEEYKGQWVRAKRGGHIPGAVNIEWKMEVKQDQTFKPAQELLEMFNSRGVTKEKEIIAHCKLAIRASHTYFTLRLLGYPRVRVYNGSWAEWGNDPSLPVEK